MATAIVSQDNVADAPSPKAGSISRISGVSVVRGADTLNIEISGSGPMTARTLRLSHPDRVVVDIPNSLLQGRAREIAVNSGDIKAVRSARYQAGITRVVVDTTHSAEFQIVPEGSKLILKLREGSSSAKPVALPETRETVTAQNATQQPATMQTNSVSAKAKEKIVEATPSRAEAAASHFTHDAPPLPSINQPPYVAHAKLAAEPAAINAALQQQQQQPQA
ncbi:MAG TPA: AMIN domain-containing protein, partial [Candidatus Sulfotelmatobacter sp.]|nr:AMIN domain-containing protein [Candidatus Sulfotelmatobacter sp.]